MSGNYIYNWGHNADSMATKYTFKSWGGWANKMKETFGSQTVDVLEMKKAKPSAETLMRRSLAEGFGSSTELQDYFVGVSKYYSALVDPLLNKGEAGLLLIPMAMMRLLLNSNSRQTYGVMDSGWGTTVPIGQLTTKDKEAILQGKGHLVISGKTDWGRDLFQHIPLGPVAVNVLDPDATHVLVGMSYNNFTIARGKFYASAYAQDTWNSYSSRTEWRSSSASILTRVDLFRAHGMVLDYVVEPRMPHVNDADSQFERLTDVMVVENCDIRWPELFGTRKRYCVRLFTSTKEETEFLFLKRVDVMGERACALI